MRWKIKPEVKKASSDPIPIYIGSSEFNTVCNELGHMNRSGPYAAYQSSQGSRNVCLLTSNPSQTCFGFRCMVDLIRDRYIKNDEGSGHMAYQAGSVKGALQLAMANRDVFVFDKPKDLYLWIGEVGQRLQDNYKGEC